MANLTTNYLGLKLINPLIIASSGLTDNIGKLRELEDKGAAAVVLKSLFEEEILHETEEVTKEMLTDHSRRESLDYIDHHIKGKNIEKYSELITAAKESLDIPVIASVNCISSYEWTYFTRQLEEAGADAIELNMYILTSDYEKSSEELENTYCQITEKVDKKVTVPVAVKISPYFTNLRNISKRLVSSGAKGIVLFNRYFNPDIDIHTKNISSTSVFSNSNDYLTSLRWVSLLSGSLDCSIAASTGIHNGETLIKVLLAGADAGHIASVVYKNGTSIIPGFIKTLEEWMDQNGYENIDAFKGMMSQKNVENPSAIERIQFMKYFSGIK